jgi:hypothetical protein
MLFSLGWTWSFVVFNKIKVEFVTDLVKGGHLKDTSAPSRVPVCEFARETQEVMDVERRTRG